jgi:hypothetical protein
MAPGAKWGPGDFFDGKPQSKTDMDDVRAYFKGIGVNLMGGNSITAARGCAEYHQVKSSWKEYSAPSWRKLYNQVQRELSKSHLSLSISSISLTFTVPPSPHFSHPSLPTLKSKRGMLLVD